ncbi:hypothetical protein ACIBJE_04390 [Micromonospora sp. NPDC050187]|uniref:hypothetical protein n=1 Tax=Micromonospora sp. NPDC050187 TaxID=3364277 RepID=UPI0037A6DEC9
MFHPALGAGHGAPVGPSARIRTKLAVSGVLTVVAAPGWTILALAATTAAIPLAVALAGGPASLRAPAPPAGQAPVPSAGGPPVPSAGEPLAPPTVGHGVGHTPEQGERTST